MESTLPTARTAQQIFTRHFSDQVSQVARFPTGLCHHVYEIVIKDGPAYVLRIATPDTRAELQGGCYWHPRLREVGVPVPALHATGCCGELAYMLMDRLPGTDLGNVYITLSSATKRSLAESIADIQETVGTLRRARKYGFAASYEEIAANGCASWAEVIRAHVARSTEWIKSAGRVETSFIERTEKILAEHEPYFKGVTPVPFLDDITTKNVIVNNGELTGVVDTDAVCFGDPLLTIGLTHMALLSLNADTEYIEHWLQIMRATKKQRRVVLAYTLLFCLCFLGELGQAFNTHVAFDEAKAEHLKDLFEMLETTHKTGSAPTS
jgi:aminoglycoside phosphotransferase (APT) family kinase protein